MPGRKYTSSATDNEYGYSGDYSRKNDQFNWNEFQFRNYDSRVGRWLSPDPAKQYHSPFVGMGNNPISVFDPTGLWGYTDGHGSYKWFDNVQFDVVFADGKTWTLVSMNIGRFEKIAHANNKGGIVENWFYSTYTDYDPNVKSLVGYNDASIRAVVGIADQQSRSPSIGKSSGIMPETYHALTQMSWEYNMNNYVYYPPAKGTTEPMAVFFDLLSGGPAKGLVLSGAKKKFASSTVKKVKEPVTDVIYKRPNNATTVAQRKSVQGQPCVDCREMAVKNVADHKTPLVKEHYQTGTIDKQYMRSLDAVQPQCPTCSSKQGAELSKYSKEMKKIIQERTKSN